MNDEAANHIQSPSLVRSHAVRSKRASVRGFSMTEVIMVISIMGVLAGIMVPKYANIYSGTKDTLANEKLEMLNQAINDWAHTYKEYSYTPNNASYTDELNILNDLEYRNPDDSKAMIGTPFIRTNYRPKGSSSTDDYRIMWTGYRFKLLTPGQVGSGIKVVFDGSDNGTPFVYPPNYSSSGR